MNLMISLGPYEIVPEEPGFLTITRIEAFDEHGEGYGPNVTIDLATLFDSGERSGRVTEETPPVGG